MRGNERIWARLARTIAALRRDRHLAVSFALVIALHATAGVIMFQTEADLVPKLAFALTWGALNFLWLGVLRRPAKVEQIGRAHV